AALERQAAARPSGLRLGRADGRRMTGCTDRTASTNETFAAVVDHRRVLPDRRARALPGQHFLEQARFLARRQASSIARHPDEEIAPHVRMKELAAQRADFVLARLRRRVAS